MRDWTQDLFNQVIREHDASLGLNREKGDEEMGIDGGRPDEIYIDEMDKQKRREIRGVNFLVLIVACNLSGLLGFSMGLNRVIKVSDQYGALFDRQNETISSLRSDILEEVQVLQRDLGIKLVFPGELDQRSKLVLMKELNQLVLKDMEEEE